MSGGLAPLWLFGDNSGGKRMSQGELGSLEEEDYSQARLDPGGAKGHSQNLRAFQPQDSLSGTCHWWKRIGCPHDRSDSSQGE